ncbi:MAG: hypothetical protein H6672_01400 [Anaerolineaceae bacterium]|nr:hypothetical protein [Anaerolineaceae bacterium]
MNPSTLESAIQDELELIAAIKQTSNRLSLPVIGVLVKTLALPFVVFTILGGLGVLARQYVDTTFQDNFLSLTTTISSYIVLLVGTWATWRWSDQRFGGATLFKGLFSVLQQVARIETAIEQAKTTGDADPATAEHISGMAYAAWEQYFHVMQDAGIPVNPETLED